MQDVGHEALDVGFEDIRFVHGGVSMDTRDAALNVQQRLNHACLGEGDCILNAWLVAVAIVDCVGRGDGQDEGEEDLQLERFHCQLWLRCKSVQSQREEKRRRSTFEIVYL